MRKLTFALAVLGSLAGAALTTPASAVPGTPTGVQAQETVQTAAKALMSHRRERRMRRHSRRHQMRHHRMHRGHSMRHGRMHRM